MGGVRDDSAYCADPNTVFNGTSERAPDQRSPVIVTRGESASVLIAAVKSPASSGEHIANHHSSSPNQPHQHGLPNGWIWPRFARLPATAAGGFFPPPDKPSLHREAKKPPAAVLRDAAALAGARSVAPGRSIAIEAALVRSEQRRNDDMAIIGKFINDENHEGFTGTIKTLTLNCDVEVRPVEKDNDKAPDFRIYTAEDGIEVGAGWSKVSRERRDYVSIKLNDPSFPAPIYASLVEVPDMPGDHHLIWSR